MKQKLQKYYPYILIGCALVLLLLINLFYQDNWLDSDMAAEMIFSKLLSETGHIFATPEWCYSTEFRFLYTHLVMAPLFHVFSSWHLIRTITNFVFYVLLLVSYFYFMEPLKVSHKSTALTSLLLLLPFSDTMLIHMQIGNTYMSHVIILFFFFGMFLRLSGFDEKARKPVRKWLLITLYVFLAAVCGISGVRYLLALICPLMLTAVLYVLRSEDCQTFRKLPSKEAFLKLLRGREMLSFYYSILGFAGSILGYAINMLYISKNYSFQTYDATNFITISDGVLLSRLQNAFGSLLLLFGYLPGKSVLSSLGLVSLSSFLIIALFIFCIVKCFKRGKGSHFFVTLFVITAFFVNVFAFLFTTSTMVPRYYITIFIFILPVIAFYFAEEKFAFDKTVFGLLLAGCFLIGIGKTVLLTHVDNNEAKRPVAEFLAENNYTFGYATFTNANIMTELTNGTVEIANVWDPDGLYEFKWSSPMKYYEEGYHDGEVFLLLTKAETLSFADAPVVINGESIYDDGNYVVLLFTSKEALMQNKSK